eukprot:XP_012822819.1 PREDICTED: perlwapin-like [Xenopus tropicalis]
MDLPNTFLLLIVVSAIDLCLSQELTEDGAKPGDCSSVNSKFYSNQPCQKDSDCPGSLKCCEDPSGMKCFIPNFRSPCQGDFDCPETLKCSNGDCISDIKYVNLPTTVSIKFL